MKTRKLWESGWAIGERKKKTKNLGGNPDGEKKKLGKKKLGKKVKREDWKPDLGRI